MSNTFRRSDPFADKRAAFAQRRASRQARTAEFADLGYDEPEAFADLPMHGTRRREAARRAFGH